MLLDQLEKYHVDITCVQEMRWIGSGTIEKKDWIIFYSCGKKEHKLGAGFVIHKKVKHLIMILQPRFPRMCWFRIGGGGEFFNYSTINAHAPTEDKSDIDKDVFYDELRNLHDTCPKRDLKLIIGDLNAKIAKRQYITLQQGRKRSIKKVMKKEKTNSFCSIQKHGYWHHIISR
jgi:exonuclease III